MAGSPRRRLILGWLGLTVGAVLFALGPRTWTFRLFYAIVPGMDRFRVPARSLFLASLGASVLSGLGVEAITTAGTDWKRFAQGVRATVAALAAGLIAASARSGPSETGWIGAGARIAADPVALAALAGTFLGFEALRLRPDRRRTIAAALGVLAVAELGIYGHSLIRVAPASRFLDPGEVGRAIVRSRPEGPFRVRARDAFFGDAPAGSMNIDKTNVNDSFQVQHAADLYETLYNMFGGLGPPRLARLANPDGWRAVLRRMNTSLIVTDRDVPEIGWPVAASGSVASDSFVVRRDPEPLPRAYVVPRAEVAPDLPSIVGRFVRLDPREAVILPVDPLREAGSRQPFTPARIVRSADPDRVEVEVRTGARACSWSPTRGCPAGRPRWTAARPRSSRGTTGRGPWSSIGPAITGS